MSANGNENNDANFNNITFTIKDTKLYISIVILSAKDNQKLSKRLSKGLKDLCIGMNIKQKVRMKTSWQTSIDISPIKRFKS